MKHSQQHLQVIKWLLDQIEVAALREPVARQVIEIAHEILLAEHDDVVVYAWEMSELHHLASHCQDEVVKTHIRSMSRVVGLLLAELRLREGKSC